MSVRLTEVQVQDALSDYAVLVGKSHLDRLHVFTLERRDYVWFMVTFPVSFWLIPPETMRSLCLLTP